MATTWNAQLYDAAHSFVWKYGADLLPLLDPKPGESIVDLGCGTGHLTSQIAETGAHVIGFDRSPDMIAKARAAYPDIEFRIADIREFKVDSPVDAVFSNAVLHWIPQADEVVACVSAALKPRGRFVAEFGGHKNIKLILKAMMEVASREGGHITSPWYYPSIAEYAAVLERHGLEPRMVTLFDRLTPLDEGQDGMKKWLEQFCQFFLNAFSSDRREAAIQALEDMVRPDLYRGGRWYADYRRLRVMAVKE